jgi:hypothetical protein
MHFALKLHDTILLIPDSLFSVLKSYLVRIFHQITDFNHKRTLKGYLLGLLKAFRYH